MGFGYAPPRHAHRTPAEIAEDEILAVMRGDLRGMPAEFRQVDIDENQLERLDAKRKTCRPGMKEHFEVED
jgi:hypothetical protein